MRRTSAGLALVLILLAVAAKADPPVWTVDGVGIGMTRDEVVRVIGRPSGETACGTQGTGGAKPCGTFGRIGRSWTPPRPK